MPEGDSLVRVAHRLRPVLEGRPLTHADLRVPRHATADLTGWTVAEVLPRSFDSADEIAAAVEAKMGTVR